MLVQDTFDDAKVQQYINTFAELIARIFVELLSKVIDNVISNQTNL